MNTQQLERRSGSPEQAAGLVIVVALHAAALWLLLQHRLIPVPTDAMTLFVNFIAPPSPEPPVPPKPLPKQKPTPIEKPKPQQLVAETPVVTPEDHVVQTLPVPPAPVVPSTPPPSMPLPTGPVALATELSVACTDRIAPAYPQRSRRNGEEGTVILRVELSEAGNVDAARVQTSSGFPRLDEAAIAAVRAWRCQPARRNGQPISTTALQPFKFVLQES